MNEIENRRLENELNYLQARKAKADALPDGYLQSNAKAAAEYEKICRRITEIRELLRAPWPPGECAWDNMDPRQDLAADHGKWCDLLFRTQDNDNGKLWGLLHYLRCNGSTISGDNLTRPPEIPAEDFDNMLQPYATALANLNLGWEGQQQSIF